ncbi:uncharacterized protein LOC134187154 [Corticium candelabrum]|uniref:uncharacterized protein LOC134187154 n=1 Tax=Corticium candelabrum TaxID=121492 RepID=UPI002E268250|nr:uncharacterized protein LOC134187154 [Corticium candelabrum]
MIIPMVQFGISDKDPGGQMPTSSPSSRAIPVIRVSVQPIAITPITIFENDLENRLKLPRVVCDEDCILQLLGKTCRYPFCWEEISVQKKHIGSTLTLQWHCKKFHQGSWSSAQCKSQNGYPFFINNLLFAASVFLSGNSFSKISLLCQFFRLNSISQSTFDRIQNAILADIGDRPVVLAGDGHCDSPGFSAKYCVYSLMDIATRKVVDVQFVGKRETELKSPRMEKLGLQRALTSIQKKIKVIELVTDASISISAMLSKDIT